ncbi:hypothetical protein V6N13_090568 [Hibiscus sabdariffa]
MMAGYRYLQSRKWWIIQSSLRSRATFSSLKMLQSECNSLEFTFLNRPLSGVSTFTGQAIVPRSPCIVLFPGCYKYIANISGEEKPNISKPSSLPGGCNGGRLVFPCLCRFAVS